MIEAFVAPASRIDEDAQLLTDSCLANVLGQALGANGMVDTPFPGPLLGGYQSIIVQHGHHLQSCSPLPLTRLTARFLRVPEHAVSTGQAPRQRRLDHGLGGEPLVQPR